VPRYFFHIVQTGYPPIPDDEGEEHEDLLSARREAVASLRDLIVEAVKRGTSVNGLQVQIANADGKVLDSINAKLIFDA
jgi:hypothetical protein